MVSLEQWLAAYSLSHQNRTNRNIHHACVPAIQFSILGLLWLIVLPFPENWHYSGRNLATLCSIGVIGYYLVLSWRYALGMTLMTLLMLFLIHLIHASGYLLWISLGIFIAAWVGQFVGHSIEGQRPSFFEDARFLLIGPLWVISHIYESLGIQTDSANRQ